MLAFLLGRYRAMILLFKFHHNNTKPEKPKEHICKMKIIANF